MEQTPNMTLPKEVRTGNWIRNEKGEIIKVRAEQATIYNKNMQSITPIDITIGILISNGFKEYDMDADWLIYLKHCEICEESPYRQKKGNNTLPFTLFSKREQSGNSNTFHIGFTKEPAYLHQLQNLHQDILGTELIVLKSDLE